MTSPMVLVQAALSVVQCALIIREKHAGRKDGVRSTTVHDHHHEHHHHSGHHEHHHHDKRRSSGAGGRMSLVEEGHRITFAPLETVDTSCGTDDDHEGLAVSVAAQSRQVPSLGPPQPMPAPDPQADAYSDLNPLEA